MSPWVFSNSLAGFITDDKETHRCYRQDISDTLVRIWTVDMAIDLLLTKPNARRILLLNKVVIFYYTNSASSWLIVYIEC